MNLALDALADTLAMLDVDGLLFPRFEGCGPWSLKFPGCGSQISFGCVTSGHLHLKVQDAADWITLHEGDFYFLTNGGPYCWSSEPMQPAVDGPQVYEEQRDADGVVRIGDDGPLVTILSGRFSFSDDADELLLRHLPPLIHVRSGEPGAPARADLLDLLSSQTVERRLGSTVASTCLAWLVLADPLQTLLANSREPIGRLGAMRDARIGATLHAVHTGDSQRWSVDSLARVAGLSREIFVKRFKEIVGETPYAYVSNWRMRLACRALLESDERIAAIAERLGYQSTQAFAMAFKGATGQRPTEFRESSAGLVN